MLLSSLNALKRSYWSNCSCRISFVSRFLCWQRSIRYQTLTSNINEVGLLIGAQISMGGGDDPEDLI